MVSMAKIKKGKFIVLEGIDGAGVETNGKLLTNYFQEKGVKVGRVYYPGYEGPIGQMLHNYLNGQFDLSVEVQFLIHLSDFMKDKEKINGWLREGKTVIADRYFSSTLAYQSIKGFKIQKALEIAGILELPAPDLIIHINVSPKTSMMRKLEENNRLDRNESDEKLLKTVGDLYKKLAKKDVFAKWIMVDGEKKIEEVFEEIKLKAKF
jgi:dTMP kinase